MSRANLYKPSGSAGEFSPRLHARTDFTKYNAAWDLAENVIPLAEGGMMRRPGTRYVHALADQTKRGSLIPFLFSNTQAYPLVFEEESIYFNRNQARILVADTDAAISNGSFDTDLTDWDDQSTGSASIEHSGVRVAIDSALGTNIGDMTDNGGLAAAFDGNTDQANTSCASVVGTVNEAFVGKNWGSGNKRTITGFTAHGSNNQGFIRGSNPATTLTLQGSSDNFVSDVNNLGDISFTDTDDESAGRSKLTGLTESSYQYHRLRTSHPGSPNHIHNAELILFEADPLGVTRMSLLGNGSDIAWAEQDVTTTATGTEHVLAFRVIGTQGDKVQISIGTTSTGGELINDREYGTGWHIVAFTPTVSPFYVQFKNPNDYTIAVDDVSLLDSQHLTLATPYAEADLQALYPVQSADVMYIFHNDYPTYKLLRHGHTSWSLERVAWQDGPWLPQNSTATTLTPSAVSGRGITVTASSTTGINGDAGFSSDDVGRLVRISNTGDGSIDWGWAVITAVATSKSVTVAVTDTNRPFAGTGASGKWHLGSWSDETGWPRCGLFFEQRLFGAGTTKQPQTFVASQTSDFENMSPDSEGTTTWDGTVQDDDSFDYTISSNQVDTIVSMAASADDMFFLTSGGAWRPASSGASMTPTDITVRRQVSSAAAGGILPLAIDNIVLFVQRGLRKIRELGFNFEVDGYRAFDMTRLSQHMTRGKIREVAYAEEPESQVFALLENGKLPAMTFRREEDVVGWARHILGGAFSSGDAVVESVGVIPGNNGAGQTFDSTERDEVWLIVKRTIDGGTKRYVEFIERAHDGGDHDAEDAFYVDSGLTYDGSAETVITGLDHLEGETAKVWADGDIHPDRTVSGGSITLASAASVVQVGLGYTHKLKNLKLEGGAEAGTAITKRKRIVKMGFVMLDSRQFKYGKDASNLITVDLSSESAFANGLFTGEIVRDWPEGWQDDPRIYIESDEPAPFILLALSPETDTKEFV